MAFLIPDNLKSRGDVPAHVRRVADAMQIGLDEAATLWYEPLYDAAGERPHFVLLAPDRGIVVLEVLSTDSKGVLGALRGKLRLKIDGAEMEQDAPIVRAERLAESLRGRLAAEQRLAGTAVPVAAGAVFTGLRREDAEKARLDKVLDLDGCIYRDEIDAAVKGDGEAALRRALVRMLGGAECSLDDTAVMLVRGIVQPDTVIAARLSNGRARTDAPALQIFSPPEGEDVVRVMDRKQEALAKSLGSGHRVIRGVAGSGKTLVLMYRARLLARAQPRKSFLLTCYTRTLAGQLRHLLTDTPNVEVTHIDGVMTRAIKKAGLRHPGYKDNGAGVWSAALRAQELGVVDRYDGVLIDEAQDFSTDMLRFAVGLLADDGDLVVVADAAQNIFRRSFSWKSAGIQAQGRTRLLRTNYRNTREILEFAHSFLLTAEDVTEDDSPDFDNENQVIPPEAASREGPPPSVHLVPDDQEAGAVVAQVARWAEEAPAGERIAVLYASSRSVNPRKIRDRLAGRGIHVFWLTDPSDPKAKDALPESTADLILSTTHSAKGLEFPRAVLCGLWRDDEEETANRMTVYVGMTRAQNHLAVVYPQDGPLAQELREASRVAGAPV